MIKIDVSKLYDKKYKGLEKRISLNRFILHNLKKKLK